MKGQGHRGQRSNLFFYVCSPTSPRSLGRSSPNLLGRLRAAPDIRSRGSFLKVKVIEVKGAAPDIRSRGSFLKGRGQRSNFCISAVLGPICMKLDECIQVNP